MLRPEAEISPAFELPTAVSPEQVQEKWTDVQGLRALTVAERLQVNFLEESANDPWVSASRSSYLAKLHAYACTAFDQAVEDLQSISRIEELMDQIRGAGHEPEDDDELQARISNWRGGRSQSEGVTPDWAGEITKLQAQLARVASIEQ